MPKTKIRRFTVELELPPGATIPLARDYIESAVVVYCGSLFPGSFDEDGDPMFDLNRDSVRVRYAPRRKARRQP